MSLDQSEGSRCLIVNSQGPWFTLVVIAEQLCWLGAACRASSDPHQPCRTKPFMRFDDTAKNANPTFIIRFDETFSNGTVNQPKESLRCWELLFRNPSIADGFPAPVRSEQDVGMEIPLHMMADLGEVDRVVLYDDRLLLKGFCSMFIPTATTANSVTWHFMVNTGGSYLPFTDVSTIADQALPIDMASLAGCRHFVGWTPNAASFLGKQPFSFCRETLDSAQRQSRQRAHRL